MQKKIHVGTQRTVDTHVRFGDYERRGSNANAWTLLIKKSAVCAMICIVSTTLFAADCWYVDAVNGNDTWDGTTATAPEAGSPEGTPGPRKTLVK